MAGRQQQTGLRSSQIQGRIKRIIQSDDDVGKVAAASTFIVACAVEKFLDTILKSSLEAAQIRDARTLTSAHLKEAIHNNPLLDFCAEHVLHVADLPPVDSEGKGINSEKRHRSASVDLPSEPKKSRAGVIENNAFGNSSETQAVALHADVGERVKRKEPHAENVTESAPLDINPEVSQPENSNGSIYDVDGDSEDIETAAAVEQLLNSGACFKAEEDDYDDI